MVPIDDGGANPKYTVSSPIAVKQVSKVAPRVAPRLGEHTDTVLADLGFNPGQVEELRSSGVIPPAVHLEKAAS